MSDGDDRADAGRTDGTTGVDIDTDTGPDDSDSGSKRDSSRSPGAVRRNTPGGGVRPGAQSITPDAPEEFGLVQVWWGNGKGKTTAALGMAVRAAGHGFRVHLLQFLKGGADSVEAVRGEYNAIAALPGLSYENLGHYGWAGMADGSDDADHAAQVEAGLERARELVDSAADADLSTPFDLDSPPEDGVHMLVLDEVLYAVSMDLLAPDDLLELVEDAPDGLELVLTGSHDEPTYLLDHADLVTEVRKSKHPMDDGQRARRGAEY
ncbi:cob(I)alamin adenolsyltransferase [Salinigranum rubrum]|uniref:Cob(I)alamin adenolsyltransferase n=1 Tax=Salinigranum rubrum TaxID=755307 RepID=A0A2I8VI56_9EURY|nr:cob(I)yrinic acid a,c-diamide adenosyltransferase [Salinigranum rubrum]AUV80729.1 cob(I)alamin adenolsyltransferase [Salinigranum rubrum]